MRKSVIRSVVFGSILSAIGLSLIITGSVYNAPQKSSDYNQRGYLDTIYRLDGHAVGTYEYELSSYSSYVFSTSDSSDYLSLSITDGTGRRLVSSTSTNNREFQTSDSSIVVVRVENNNNYYVRFKVMSVSETIYTGSVGVYYTVDSGSEIKYSYSVNSNSDYVFSTKYDRNVSVDIVGSDGSTLVSGSSDYSYSFNTGSCYSITVTVRNSYSVSVSFILEEDDAYIGQLDSHYSIEANTEVKYQYNLSAYSSYIFSSSSSVYLTINGSTYNTSYHTFSTEETGDILIRINNENSSSVSFVVYVYR